VTDWVWPPGSATGLGSLPGTDPVEAVRLVLGETAELPYLPELPARGLGADMVGRTGSLLLDLPLEWQPHGWTLTARTGSDYARARDWLRWDLDAVTEQAQGVDVLKIQVCGPMTLAASIELPNLHKVLTDHGAFRDLAESLADGVRMHLDEISARLPGTRIVLQVDEPALPAVLGGQIPTPSGYGTVRALSTQTAQQALEQLLAVAEPGRRVVHCCAAEVPLRLIGDAGADAVAVDRSHLRVADFDAIGEFVEAGGSLWLGVVPATDSPIDLKAARASVDSLWNALGFGPEQLPAQVVVTPSCGMAGASMGYVRKVAALLRDLGHALRD
jgi:methionine synthase II (cobalamin-independent)